VLCTFADPRINESSGIVASSAYDDVLYTHNDSGDSARFFAIDGSCRTRATFVLSGVQARDWEDISRGPRDTLWLGDIGDNNATRDRGVLLHRVLEPQPTATGTVRVPSVAFRFRYADGPHNAEALLIRPHSGRLYVVTKSSAGGGIYRAPKDLSTRRTNILHRVASAPVLVTGGDFAPNGRRFVLRTHNYAYFYKKIGGHARVVKLPEERQGEAIGFTRGSRAVKVASEGIDQPIWRVAR